jgi:hypothetical protein
MDLKPGKGAAVGINEEDVSDNSLYIIIYDEQKEGTFKVAKAGDYYYLNLRSLFDTLKINYKAESIIYDISPERIDKQMVFNLSRRESSKRDRTGNEINRSGTWKATLLSIKQRMVIQRSR